jgi:hypothetical protein
MDALAVVWDGVLVVVSRPLSELSIRWILRAAASRPPKPKASVAVAAPPTTSAPKANSMIESAMPM